MLSKRGPLHLVSVSFFFKFEIEALELTDLLALHDFVLALFGTPIGELWDLEKLATVCRELNRWSFFLTSAPLNVIGGIASPPNALAVF